MRSHCCLCVCVCLCISPSKQRLSKNPHIVARQRLSRTVTEVTNRHATTELLDPSFSMWPMSYQEKHAISSSQNFLFYL
jgi:hypothetical protein